MPAMDHDGKPIPSLSDEEIRVMYTPEHKACELLNDERFGAHIFQQLWGLRQNPIDYRRVLHHTPTTEKQKLQQKANVFVDKYNPPKLLSIASERVEYGS